MEEDRLNSPNTSAIVIEVLGHRLHLSQDPNSKHLGTTVWDSSMVFIKFLTILDQIYITLEVRKSRTKEEIKVE
ncbi:hypothetical protein HPP92_025057 [Vanilla planifolia]|uniref:Uncharacterized protein n=1 Tax=Vanilla planifolia TaxID=51239 RepID=A0A835PLY6_VANPL|nr:hypothetical protein HPP92_025057 [Vanilla planifolia]